MTDNQHSKRDERGDSDASPMEEAAVYAAFSHIAWDDRPIEQTLTDVAVLTQRALPETPETSLTLLGDNRPRTAAFSGDLALQLDKRQYDDGDGPCLDAAIARRVIQVAIDDPDGPYPGFRQSARREGVTHSLSVGMPGVGAALNIYSSTGLSFTADSTRIARTLAGFAGFGLTSATRRDHGTVSVAVQLQRAVATRTVVLHAQGLLMAQLHCSREQAFTHLIELSEQQRVKLHEAAQAVVDQTG